jgi:hydroxymethylpyrimidine/phosphomethylpyrimidine kinase
MLKKVLSIAGFDGSGGAGIQADLKTFSALGCYGMSVLTALPIQNTCGVRNCYEIPVQAIQEQLTAIFDDIIPDAIKIGMLFNAPIIETVADFLKKNALHIPIILDPVMVAKSGDHLLQPEALFSLKETLIPLCHMITPNLPEAAALVGQVAHHAEEMPAIAESLLSLGCYSVLLKGGHLDSPWATDIYVNSKGEGHELKTSRIITQNTHGTGCTLSAAIASGMALGMTDISACQMAKKYLKNALLAAQTQKIGQGHGPVHHFYHLWPTLDKI